jgi:SAM-dependent methyltransferase
MAGDGNGVGEAAVAAEQGQPDWAPEGVDLSTPSVARAYDYALGGAHSFAVDREFFRALEAALPDARLILRANRAFLHRSVRFMVEAGVRQFLDLGSGIPTVGNVHEIAQRLVPETRVVYVDIDPVAVAHSRLILAGNDRATAIQEDLRHADAILGHPDTRALLDFDQPVGLILAAILHAVPDEDDPYGIVRRLCDVLSVGSYVAISHATADSRAVEARAAEQVTKRTSTPGTLRTRAEVLRFFTGFDLVEPGLVWTPQWRPEHPDDVGDHPERMVTYAGVGRRR